MGIMDYMPQFGQNVDQQMPQDDSMMQLELQRRMKFADALRNQAAPEGQMVSGHYVAPSWTQHLASLANKYVAGQNEQQAMKQYGEAQTSKAQKLADLMKGKTTFEADAEGNQREVTKPYTNEELIGQLSGIDSSYGPKLFDTYLANRYKEKQGHVLTPGSTYYEDGKAVYTAPKETVEKSAFGTVNPGDFTPASLARFAQAGGKDYSVLIPVPKTMTPYESASLNLRTQELNKPAKLKEVPPTQKGAYIGNVASISQIDDTLAKLDAAPDAWFGIKGGMGDQFMQRAYPESNDIRAAIGGVSSIKRHDISGAAVSPSEDKKLAQYIPNPTDDKKAIKDKLTNFKNELMRSNQAIQGSYGDEYSPLSKQQSPTAAPTIPAPRLGSGKINEGSLKAGVIYDLGGGKSGAWNPKTRTFD
jgi:hypothetical protein